MKARLCIWVSVLLIACVSAGVSAQGSPGARRIEVVAYDQNIMTWYQTVGELFMRAHPDVTIEYLMIPGGEYAETIVTRAAAGLLPDVANMMMRWAPALYEQGIVKDLRPYVERSDVDMSLYFPTFTQDWTYRGALLGFPMNPSAAVTVYDVEAFNEAGLPQPHDSWLSGEWSWDTALEAGKMLTRDLDGDGTIDQWGYNPTHSTQDWGVFSVIYSGGGRVLSDDLTRSEMSHPNTLSTLEWAAEVYNVHQAGRFNLPVTARETRFGTGVAEHAVNMQRALERPYAITVVPPRTAGEDPVHAILGPAHSLLTDNEAAWEFILFLSSEEAARLMVEITGRVPALRQGAEYWLDGYKAGNPDVLLTAPSYAKGLPYHPKWWTEIWPVVNSGLWQIFSGEQPARSVVEELDRRINAILAE